MGHSGDVELPAMPNVPLLTDHILLCIDQHLLSNIVYHLIHLPRHPLLLLLLPYVTEAAAWDLQDD
ncbi:unnamed protein product [Leuciscus chuanchicus]